MKKNLTQALAAALTVGLLTVNACALTPTISYPCHANSPFVPDFPFPPPPPPSIDTPFVPDCCFPDLTTSIADVSAGTEQPSITPTAPAAAAGEKLYTVKAGDTLAKIAAAEYGSSSEYKAIFERNADRLKSPDLIFEAQVIVLPAK